MPPLDKRQMYGSRGAANNAPYSGAIVPGADLLDELREQINEDSKLNAQPIKISDVYPDPNQARTVLPSAIRSLWSRQADLPTMEELFSNWWKLVNRERSDYGFSEFDLMGFLEGRVIAEEIGKDDLGDAIYADAGPLETSLLHIVNLSALIKDQGLINAITVAATDENGGLTYKIETGERRWFAYQLLRVTYPQANEWLKIPARVVPRSDVWRQSSENTARQNLSAIEKARQYAILVMQAIRESKPVDHGIRARSDFSHEHQYHLQAYNHRVPDGYRSKIMKALGVTSTSEMTLCRNLLLISDKVWDLADDYKVPQSKILECIELSEPMALNYLGSMFDHRTSDKGRTSETAEGEKAKLPPASKPSELAPKAAFGSVWRAFVKGKPIKRSQYEALKAWITEIEDKNEWAEEDGK